jgi:DNA-3-methyladenine glycosylase II
VVVPLSTILLLSRLNNHFPIVNDASVKALFDADPLFKSIHDRIGLPANWSRPPGFVSLSRIILDQQVSLASAYAHYVKLNSYIPAFTPEHILKLSDAEMRACQISRQKAKYLRALSDALMSGELNLDTLAEQPDSAIRRQLTNIKGIGEWTTDIYMIMCLQSPDIFPIGDIALVNATRELTTASTKEQILELAEQWRPFRSLAAFFLWHHYLTKRGRVAY